MTNEQLFVALVTDMNPGMYAELTDTQLMIYEEELSASFSGTIYGHSFTVTPNGQGGAVVHLNSYGNIDELKKKQEELDRSARIIEKLQKEVALLEDALKLTGWVEVPAKYRIAPKRK